MINNCIVCNKSFKTKPNRILKGWGKYCSRKCKCLYQYPSSKDRFFNQTEKKSNNTCWQWIGALAKSGYGVFHVNGKVTTAHRYSWTLHYGKIPKGLFVLHKCDIRNCVNPKHLFTGTNHDNIKDMINKGRNNPPKGSNCHTSKLTEKEVIKIKKLIKIGKSTSYLAKLFNIGKRQIIYIKNNESWKHVSI